MRWKRFRTGKKIFAEGVVDQNFYINLRGKIEIRKRVGTMKKKSVGFISRGEVFGEMAVTNPAKPRRASAYVASKDPAIACEVDATLLDSIPQEIRAKFLKKFLDLILNRIDVDARKKYYYEDIIDFAQHNGMPEPNPFFKYSIESAVSEKNKITQLTKYTDFLIAKKLSPEKSNPFLQSLLVSANKELNDIFQVT